MVSVSWSNPYASLCPPHTHLFVGPGSPSISLVLLVFCEKLLNLHWCALLYHQMKQKMIYSS